MFKYRQGGTNWNTPLKAHTYYIISYYCIHAVFSISHHKRHFEFHRLLWPVAFCVHSVWHRNVWNTPYFMMNIVNQSCQWEKCYLRPQQEDFIRCWHLHQVTEKTMHLCLSPLYHTRSKPSRWTEPWRPCTSVRLCIVHKKCLSF